jgi:L-aspartate oxidase
MHDYVVVGSGIAGLFTALLAARHGRVLVVTKANLEESNTRYAQGGIAAATDPADSPLYHYEDTLDAGAGLCEPHAVDVLTRLAPDRIADLVRFGVQFDLEDGQFARGREAAHRRSRILHAGGDATGARVEVALCHTLRAAGVDIRENHFLIDLLEEGDRVVGVRVLDPDGHVRDFAGRAIVLASGGSGQLFSHTTNPAIATGDGLAAAYRAGAAVADLEFYQFHPTALALPGASVFLISEAVRGEGGILRDSRGRAFARDYDPRGELAPRDVVSRGIVAELARSGESRVYLDVTHLSAELIRRRFPTITRFCADHGLDLTREPIPVAPAAHYQMGGVLTNSWGETTLPGLYACGEVAASGVHGANRLASNSLLEGIVFASRIVQRTLGEGALDPPSALLPPLTSAGPTPNGRLLPAPTLEDIQRLAWEQVGLARNASGIEGARRTLAAWTAALRTPANRSDFVLANLTLIGLLMAEAARLREESRGAHFRSDFPVPAPAWRRRIVFQTADARAAEAWDATAGRLAAVGERREV